MQPLRAVFPRDRTISFDLKIERISWDQETVDHISKHSVTPEEEGLLVIELTGEQEDYDKGIGYLTGNGVRIQSLSRDVNRNEERCTHCGACITICPTGAFRLEPQTRHLLFDNGKCIACGLCIKACPKACPPRAMEVHF
jgi:ferredoxin